MDERLKVKKEESESISQSYLKLRALDELTNRADLRTLSILNEKEVTLLSLGLEVAELHKLAEDILLPFVRNYLLLKMSLQGAGRKDMKDIINPYRIYPFYYTPQQLPSIEEQSKEEKKKRFKLF